MRSPFHFTASPNSILVRLTFVAGMEDPVNQPCSSTCYTHLRFHFWEGAPADLYHFMQKFSTWFLHLVKTSSLFPISCQDSARLCSRRWSCDTRDRSLQASGASHPASHSRSSSWVSALGRGEIRRWPGSGQVLDTNCLGIQIGGLWPTAC